MYTYVPTLQHGVVFCVRRRVREPVRAWLGVLRDVAVARYGLVAQAAGLARCTGQRVGQPGHSHAATRLSHLPCAEARRG